MSLLDSANSEAPQESTENVDVNQSQQTNTDATVESEPENKSDAVESTPNSETPDTPTEDNVEDVEHPEWFKSDKYESIEDQAKAYADLESRFGSFTGAPEEYTLEAGEEFSKLLEQAGVGLLPNDDPFVQEMGAIAKELNMSQEGFNKFAQKYIGYQLENDMQHKQLLSQQIGEKRINNVASWGKANLSAEEFKLLEGATTSIEGFQFVELMMNQLRGEPDLSHKGVNTSGALTREEIVSMQSKPEYKTDATYRAKVSQAWQDFHNKS